MTPGHSRAGILIVAAALAGGAGLAGCAGDPEETAGGSAGPNTVTSTGSGAGGGTSSSSTSAGTSTGSSGTSSGNASSGIADAVTALQTAAAAVPDGQPFDLERDRYQGQQVWDVKVASDGNQFNLYVSADGTDVLSRQQDQTPDDDIAKLQSTQLDAVQALRMAAGDEGGSLSEMEIDSADDGSVVWQVELRQADGSVIEENLDAQSGEVVSRQTGG